MTQHVDVAVIGAGVTGLATAWAAEREGAVVAVLESEAECGGVIKSDNVDGYLVERGATSMAGTAAVMSMLRQLSIHDEVVVPPEASKRRFVVRNGTLCALPASPLEVLTTSALSMRGKLRAFCEPLIRRSAASVESESVAALVRRRFGRDVADYVVDPFISGVYAGDPNSLSSRFALRMLAEFEREYGSVAVGAIRRARRSASARRAQRRSATSSTPIETIPHILSFRRGMQTLPRSLAASLSRPVQTRTRVTNVQYRSGYWHVGAVSQEGKTSFTASAVVVTLPAHQAGSVTWPQEFEHALNRLKAIPHAAVATVALGFSRTAVRHPLNGFGVLVPYREKREVLGALFNSTMFAERAPAHRVLLTCFVGGARFEGDLDSEQIKQVACRELASLLGAADPEFISARVWQNGIPQFNLGHEVVEPAMRKLEAAWPGLIFSGSWRTGVSVGDCLSGGLDAGFRAAAASRAASSAITIS